MLFFAASTQVDLDRILSNPKLDGAIVSAIVTDLEGQPLYERNSTLHVVPASNQKLLSSAFALWALGTTFHPKTRFWKEAGSLIIDSEGDPLMSYADLVRARSAMGVRHAIRVLIHQAYAPQIPDSWEIDDLPFRYSAPITAFTFDQSAFEVWFKSGRVLLLPEAFGVSTQVHPSKSRLDLRYDPFARTLNITGKLPDKDLLLEKLALPRPDQAAASVFGNPSEAPFQLPLREPDYVIIGSSSADMVTKCLPPSDNNIAENLLLLGARTEGELGESPYDKARVRAENFLHRVVGVPNGDVHVFDGSGLSRHNFVTTRAIAKLLAWENKQSTSELYHQALPHPGTGTLANRLKGLAFQGKTGSLDMVSSLSGYLTTRSGRQVIVSLILNEYGCSAAEARKIQDEFVTSVSAD